jgi:hypothetical protein
MNPKTTVASERTSADYGRTDSGVDDAVCGWLPLPTMLTPSRPRSQSGADYGCLLSRGSIP